MFLRVLRWLFPPYYGLTTVCETWVSGIAHHFNCRMNSSNQFHFGKETKIDRSNLQDM